MTSPLPSAENRSAQRTSGRLLGISFEIADLRLAQAWAERHDIEMCIRLDHGAPAEEYEEVIALRGTSALVAPVIVWRDKSAVFVQPLLGRRRRYISVCHALESLIPEQDVTVTDIVATEWPSSPLNSAGPHPGPE
jgi:hypothetical protein